MEKNPAYNLTPRQKDAIAEQLAAFFFGYWDKKQNTPNNQLTARNGQVIVSDPGLLRNFPGDTETMT